LFCKKKQIPLSQYYNIENKFVGTFKNSYRSLPAPVQFGWSCRKFLPRIDNTFKEIDCHCFSANKEE